MRVQVFFALCLLALMSFAHAQTTETSPSPRRTTHYFMIDASGSMASKMAEAEERVQALVDEIKRSDAHALISRTYFRADTGADTASCSTPIEISPAVSAAQSAGENQTGRGSTPLGAALDAVLSRAGAGPARVYIVSDGDQTPGCGGDVCAIARDRLPRPGVSVEFAPVGSIDPADSDRLGCIFAAQLSPTGSELDPAPSPVARSPFWSGWIARAMWIVTLLLAAASAIAFGLHYSRQASTLEKKIKGGAVSTEDGNFHKGAADEFKQPSWIGRVFVSMAVMLFLLIWLCPLFLIARVEALRNLDTEFGAAIFLAGALSLAGWSASLYWRFFEARREYYIVINRAEMERRSRERRDKERQLDTYNRDRDAILLYAYDSDRSRMASRLEIDSNDARLEELVAELIRRAVGEDRQIDNIAQSDIERVSKFRKLLVRFSLQRLVSALRDADSLNEDAATKLQTLLSTDAGSDAGQLVAQLDRLLTDLQQA